MQQFSFPNFYIHPSLSDGEERGVYLNKRYMNNQVSQYESFWNLKNFNNITIFVHFLQALIVLVLCFTNLDEKPSNILFLTTKKNLSYTNYAMINVNKHDETCQLVKENSEVYKTKIATNDLQGLTVYNDILPHHNFYDYTNKTLLQFNVPDYFFETQYALVAIFLLSVIFQGYNGMYMGFEESFPRIIYNIEESISGGLIVMILALNTGIVELYTLIAFFGIIFAMNICNLCADASSWYVSVIMENKMMKYIWLIPQITAWILLFFVFIPILLNLERTRDCSNTIPSYIVITIYIEFIFFIVEQLTQTALCTWRSFNSQANAEYYSDFASILLGAVSKTFLAWMLLIPTLNASDI
jgi:hypothetical protein